MTTKRAWCPVHHDVYNPGCCEQWGTKDLEPVADASCSCAAHREQGAYAACAKCAPWATSMAGVTRRFARLRAVMTASPTPDARHDGPCAHGTPCATSPTAMLGEAVGLANRAESLAFDAFHATSTAGAPDGIASARVLLVEAIAALKRAKDELGKRTANCPRGVHGGPGSDACDCAAIAKVDGVKNKLKLPSNSCWRCDAPLGTTEGCYWCAFYKGSVAEHAPCASPTCPVCAAKRREDNAPGVG